MKDHQVEPPARARIVVLDGATLDPGDNPWDEVAALGDLVVHDRTPEALVVDRAREADIVLTNKTPLAAAALASLPRLRFVSVLATGYNIVDVEAARRRGIPVSNVPEYGTRSVAQLVFALVLELCHRVGLHDRAVRDGEWAARGDFSFWKTPLVELAGKTMAVIGYGRIGRAVGELAHAFGMEVLAVDPAPGPSPAWGPFAWCGLDDAFRRADVLSLNCALTAENAGLVDARRLALMKPSAFLVNAARGALVVEADLAAALAARRIAGAALDVVSSEPIRVDNPLLAAPSCILTPHIAWATREARARLMHATAANVRAFLAGAPVHVVNGL